MVERESGSRNKGKIVGIRGPILDVEFSHGKIPDIYNALEIIRPGRRNSYYEKRIVAEVQQSIGNNQVRAIAMSSTDGLYRGVL
jgi:F-type H+-transporting ATPase subunit beta